MSVIFLYGPPAVGKLTVAKELSSATGIPIFHNHLTRDLVENIFPTTLSDNYGLVTILRNEVFEYCSKQNQSLIFTWVYDGSEDDAALEKMVSAVEDNGGEVQFVELMAPKNVLIDRVANESRSAYRKLTDKKILHELFERKTFGSIPYDNVLKVDVSEQSPEGTALSIIKYYKLPQKI